MKPSSCALLPVPAPPSLPGLPFRPMRTDHLNGWTTMTSLLFMRTGINIAAESFDFAWPQCRAHYACACDVTGCYRCEYLPGSTICRVFTVPTGKLYYLPVEVKMLSFITALNALRRIEDLHSCGGCACKGRVSSYLMMAVNSNKWTSNLAALDGSQWKRSSLASHGHLIRIIYLAQSKASAFCFLNIDIHRHSWPSRTAPMLISLVSEFSV